MELRVSAAAIVIVKATFITLKAKIKQFKQLKMHMTHWQLILE
jgi:hypothetical protein